MLVLQQSKPTQPQTIVSINMQDVLNPNWNFKKFPLFYFRGKKKFRWSAAPPARNTARPQPFAAKSIMIITCGDEFPLMVAGPQQPPLIMTFCSCWQPLPADGSLPTAGTSKRALTQRRAGPATETRDNRSGTLFTGELRRPVQTGCYLQHNRL